MLSEHNTTLEFCGREYPATVSYECDPNDGWPVIHSVEMTATRPGWDYDKDLPAVEKLTFDATEWLNKDQEEAIEEEIDCALKSDASAMKDDQMAMESDERGMFRRAA